MITTEKKDIRLELPVDELWEKALTLISKNVSAASFNTWIRPVKLKSIADDQAILAVSNDFIKGWIASNHLKSIGAALSTVLKREVSATIEVDPSQELDCYTPSIASISVAPSVNSNGSVSDESMQAPAINRAKNDPGRMSAPSVAGLNSEYTFDRFVVGSHNTFCHSAAQAVAERPGQTYNPLFIYGGVGLGKTHLLQAIGHKISQTSPQSSIRYISCERFTNDLINSIKDHRMIEFRKRYRHVDVLLVDDVQFIEGKESTQEEFFHTFNALKDSGRQIVLSSDRPPQSLAKLEERLRSRFEWGLIADIQAPDLETRQAILQKKSDLNNMNVPDTVLEYIAGLFTSNIRELEGALIRAHAYARLTGSPLDVETVSHILRPGRPARPKSPLTMDRIIKTLCDHFQVDCSDIKSSKRSQDLTQPRHIAMYLAHELLDMSFPKIGQSFGNRKHTSALHACKKIKASIASDREMAGLISQLTRQLQG